MLEILGQHLIKNLSQIYDIDTLHKTITRKNSFN